MTSVKLSSLIPPKFHSVWRASLNQNILHVVCEGGRGSGKSSDVAHIIIQLIMRYAVNAVCIRKTDNTLEQSVYEQLKWAISEQQVTHLFKFNKSPLRITYLLRGNYIVFRGAQYPERIKSLKDSQFPFAIGWIEELAEFKTEDEVKTITNSLLRGELGSGLFYKFFYTYNPPKRKQSWVNKKYGTQFQPANTFVHHSTYLDNPYIAKEFIEEAEATKARDERRYRWEYLGEAIGSGVVPFDNLRFETIPDDLIANFDNIRKVLTLVMQLTHWPSCVGIMTRNIMASMRLMNSMARKSAIAKQLTGLSREAINQTESAQTVLNLSLLQNCMVILICQTYMVSRKVLTRLNLVNVGLMI